MEDNVEAISYKEEQRDTVMENMREKISHRD